MAGYKEYNLTNNHYEITKEWHPTKNGDLMPSDISYGSSKKVWWKCQTCGYEWQSVVYARIYGCGCPECAKRKAIFNRQNAIILKRGTLEDLFPSIAKEWDYFKNNNLRPSDITSGSSKKVWWRCDKGHSFQQIVNTRTSRGYGCPYCSGRKSIVGVNDLVTTHPDICKEWDHKKNGDQKPENFSYGSHMKVWWECEKGHSYLQSINKRIQRGYGCPYCSGRKVLSGYNDLATLKPAIAKEWNYEKNGGLEPTCVSLSSGKRVWWTCPLGHEYQAVIRDRTCKRGTNCPICNLRKSTSFPEQAILYYVKKLYPDAENKYKDLFSNTMELDIYIPSIKLGIEFDGANWHQTEEQHNREIKKYKICRKHEITLFRVKEKNDKSWEDVADCIWYINKVRDTNELEDVIRAILYSIDVSANMWTKTKNKSRSSVKVDIQNDRNEILSYLSSIEKSLDKMRPNVLDKWNYEKNGELNPSMFTVSSNQIVWWRCSNCGQEWQSSINSMTRDGRYGCAICSQRQRGQTFTRHVIQKVGSLEANNKILALEWHPTKNGKLKPNDITLHSNKKVWWLCKKCGYEWLSAPNNRSKGVGCPCCSGRVPKTGVNDLATLYPSIAMEWDYIKNGDLRPENVLPHSGKKVWWKCPICKESHQSEIRLRVIGYGKCNCQKQRKSSK